jgi:diaminohydroxyphosphoribosylaminopyrimidine deaminase / 5-amino-6-(5-phosphoribosylamino)uracil reductase
MSADDLSREDLAHLEWARTLGRRGWGRVHPNPLVGCVIVRESRVVGEGFHADFGGPHAEIVALERARSRAEGATVYVSLEPCNHEGKTPPCSAALIQAGVSRVVFGVSDPGAASGGGAEALRAAGIEVAGPVWPRSVGQAENPAFFHNQGTDDTYLALKLAISLDGKIAARPGARTRITGADAEREVHRLRTGFDAVLIGAGTARVDDPRLTVRLVEPGRLPLHRMVIDPRAELPDDAALWADADRFGVHVFTRADVPERAIGRLERAGARVHATRVGADGRLDLDAVMAVARELGFRSVLCEGGARLAASLLREERVHRIYLFVAPLTLGQEGVAAFPEDAASLDFEAFEPAFPPEPHGRDTLIVLDRRLD